MKPLTPEEALSEAASAQFLEELSRNNDPICDETEKALDAKHCPSPDERIKGMHLQIAGLSLAELQILIARWLDRRTQWESDAQIAKLTLVPGSNANPLEKHHARNELETLTQQISSANLFLDAFNRELAKRDAAANSASIAPANSGGDLEEAQQRYESELKQVIYIALKNIPQLPERKKMKTVADWIDENIAHYQNQRVVELLGCRNEHLVAQAIVHSEPAKKTFKLALNKVSRDIKRK